MNKLAINKTIINEILDEKTLKIEIAELVNDLIDEELLKEVPDCDFIDECIDILDNLENNNYSNVVPFVNKTYKGRFSKKAWSILVACAIILAATIGTVAVGYTVEKIREGKETVTATPATTTTTQSATQTTTTTQISTAISPAELILSFSSDFNDEYIVGEDFDPKGIIVKVRMSDGKITLLSADEYEIITEKDFGKTEKHENIIIKYGELTETFSVRVLRDEDTKILNSVYATFPDNFDFRTDDIDNIDLAGMEVYAVYSDNTQEKLNKGDYTVNTELLPDKKTAMITLEYKSVYASFGIKERSLGENNE